MAKNKIDAIEFHYVHASIPPLGNELRDRTPENASNGHVKLKLGTRATEGTVRTFRDFDSVASADSHITACAAKKGTLVTVYDCHERTISNVAVLDVIPAGVGPNGDPQDIVRVDGSVGGMTDGVYLVELLWRVQKVSS